MKYLIVDDDESIHLYLKQLLAPYAEIDSAMNGKDAVSLFKKSLQPGGEPYSAVFMDILMPEMDGHAVTGKLRELEREFGIEGANEFKLVMITSLSDTKNVSKAFFKGYASCYVVKPFDKNKVLEELRSNGVLPPE